MQVTNSRLQLQCSIEIAQDCVLMHYSDSSDSSYICSSYSFTWLPTIMPIKPCLPDMAELP